MKWIICLLLCLPAAVSAQNISSKLATAYRSFEQDPQLQNALVSLYVVDAKTGQVVFDKNSRTGMAPASTQKIITAATAYALLGREYRYSTWFGYDGIRTDSGFKARLILAPAGDPTLGSWRWKSTSEEQVIKNLLAGVIEKKITEIHSIILDISHWEGESIPDGWIWQDIGNYYGAGAFPLNWRENQFDVFLQSEPSVGTPVSITGTKPFLYGYRLESAVLSAPKGTGDRSYIYFPVNSKTAMIRGTIPVSESRFSISGAIPAPHNQFVATLVDSLGKRGISVHNELEIYDQWTVRPGKENWLELHRETSPALDSISYWFLKKSINLYGEALIKTVARKSGKSATIENGLKELSDFWKSRGIASTELNMADGSGLSPLNRVTTHAQVEVLKFASRQPWFQSYFNGFPEYNGMKIKSGTINGVKGFTGYHTSRNGNQYIFSFLVNNYNGPASTLVQKMYRVMDVLK